MKAKPLTDHTDRELLEKSVFYQKQSADHTGFLKNAAIFYIVLIGLGLLGMLMAYNDAF